MNVADMTLREATIKDATFAADLDTALYPDDPQDAKVYAHRWAHPDQNFVRERFIGEVAGKPVGYAYHHHAKWEQMTERFGNVSGDVLPSHRTPARVDALIAAMEDRSRADGAKRFTAWSWEHDTLRVDVIAKRGFREERRGRFWELDLAANRSRLEAMALESRKKMRDQKISVLTVDRDSDPDKWTKLWRMSNEAEQDIPTTVPHVEGTFEGFMDWMRSPGLHEDRTWIARQGDAILGISLLSYLPPPGVVTTDWTGVARAGRGKGIARALKYETVMQAIALGVDRVRTDNDSRNAPILHINDSMGYKRRPDMIQFMRDA
ncbi:MAG: GNAT family N-acetyltransferase [Chloroflexi bacterium]|nr:MAG: GNAT family N-acetyltransferase [Chloroflexota bacterium]